MFLMILFSFSKSLSPLPPMASITNLLYWSEYLESLFPQSGCLFLKSFNNTPRYSVLTTDMGTKARAFSSKKFAKAPNADYGINVWRDDFDEQKKLFDKRYKPGELEYMPEYPKRYSLTGEFIEEGPIASNATLT